MATIRHGSTEVTGFRYGSAEVDAVYYGATEVFSAYEDGSLVIEDDTLDVDGGSTVNLRVKLGARPRSDVTVALSETSSLISLGSASLTFTPDNWDTYQSVVVTGAGNRQSISFPASTYDALNVSVKAWFYITSETYPQIDAGFVPMGETRFLPLFQVQASGFVRVNFSSQQGVGGGTAGDDLSDAFESSGSFTITAGADSVTVEMGGADTEEPYAFTPSNSAEVIAFFNALPTTDDSQAATFVLRDYVPADATISLSASGPDEYSGVTGSATVSVD